MLTETQFKVLLILFDNKGHAEWELAQDLGMEESNLNPRLKGLLKKKFIIQGKSRKSGKPRKREGDYKEIPYYLNKNLEILYALIREMVATNKVHDTGFPFRIIKTSNYIKSMRRIFKEDLNKCLVEASSEIYIQKWPCTMAPRIEILNIKKLLVEKPADPLKFKDKRVRSKKTLKELELWYESYSKRSCDQETKLL
jgi:predicted transcriptional regulator